MILIAATIAEERQLGLIAGAVITTVVAGVLTIII